MGAVAPRSGVQSPSKRRLDVKKRFSEEQIIGFLREAEATQSGGTSPFCP